MKKRRDYLLWGGVLLLAFALCWQLISSFYRQQVISQQVSFLEEKATIFLQLSENQQSALSDYAKLYVQQSDTRITLLDTQGNIVFDTTDDTLQGNRSTRPEIQAVLKGGNLGQSLRESATLETEMLYVALPIKVDGQLQSILRISEPTAPFFQKNQTIIRYLFLVYFVFCLFVTFLTFHTLRQKNHPIQTILPVLKKMVASPNQQEVIMQDTPQHSELYQTINLLSEQMSQTYQAYAASEQQLYTLLNELMIGVFVINQETDALRLLNPTMQEQLGIDHPLSLPRPFTEAILNTQLIQAIYQVNEQTPFLHKEITIETPVSRVLDLKIRFFKEKEEILGISYDLTRIRELEKMQQDFVGNVSHELKTPVTSLIGFTETLLDGAKDDPETLTSFLEIMQKDAYRLEELIQEIILLSKGRNSLNYDSQPVQVKPLLTRLSETYRPLLEEKHLHLTIEGEESLVLLTKLELLSPIFKNLIENAVKYSKVGGQITLSYQVDTMFTFHIKDEGIGIDSEDQQRIFERFYRVDKARARNSGGTGLGLAIVKDYTALLGGQITVESHLGLGTTFTLKLPLSS